MSSVPIKSQATPLVAALREYDAACAGAKDARNRVYAAERELRRLTNAGTSYMDGNELVAGLGRKLAALLEAGR